MRGLMTQVRRKGEALRRFILENITAHPNDIAKVAARKFGVTRQAVGLHLRKLVAEKALVEAGSTRSKVYRLCPTIAWRRYYVPTGLEEDLVWTNDIKPQLALPDNVMKIWGYCFTEMLNNAIDHSDADTISVDINKTATTTEMFIYDSGVGIFQKIMDALSLPDQRHALLELSKGKFTTDPSRHTGQGIFFSSRMVDEFYIFSKGTFFSHTRGRERDWLSHHESSLTGTLVSMKLSNHTARSTKQVFDQFSTGDDLSFSKTIVPVHLAQYGDEQLVSRSQAKRLLAGMDKFKSVALDFENVSSIGHSYADEIFRVFARANPGIELFAIGANEEVQAMIDRARQHASEMSDVPPAKPGLPEAG
jgi:anti-sigma regulatory factor (Ser/Thr protein kinase)